MGITTYFLWVVIPILLFISDKIRFLAFSSPFYFFIIYCSVQFDKDKTFYERYCSSLDGQTDVLVYNLYVPYR
jgi:hypothetical protein